MRAGLMSVDCRTGRKLAPRVIERWPISAPVFPGGTRLHATAGTTNLSAVVARLDPTPDVFHRPLVDLERKEADWLVVGKVEKLS